MVLKCTYVCTLMLAILYALPGATAEVQIAIRLMTPIVNTRYYIQCDVQMTTDVEDTLFYNYDVLIKDKHMECKISNWRYCSEPPPPQVHGACGCSSKKILSSGGYVYRFYLLIDPVTEAYIESQFTCEVYTAKDKRQMELVMFTDTPDKEVYSCMNSDVSFNWDFKPVRDSIVTRFTLTDIEWRLMSAGIGKNKVLGTYFIPVKGKPVFTPSTNRSKITTEGFHLPQLSLLSTLQSESRHYIQINATFYIGTTSVRSKIALDANTTTYTTFPISTENDTATETMMTTTNAKTREDSTKDDLSSDTISKTTTTTTTATTTTIYTDATVNLQTTTPASIDIELDEPERHMVHKVQLIVTVPPSPDSELSLNAYESLTGSLVVTCQVKSLLFPGDPPVNVSIWHDDKLLTSRTFIKVLHYATVSEGRIITCGLEGHSLGCLQKGDPRLVRVIFDLKDLKKASRPAAGVDLLLSLFAWESAICVIMMMWTVSLLLDHARIVLDKARSEVQKEHNYELDHVRRRSMAVNRATMSM